MNVFSTLDGNTYKIDREIYISKTRKQFPYYQEPKKYKKPYFAICPACNNPIQIINLFFDEYVEEHTGRKNMHGRHCSKNVRGLPPYSQAAYDNCPLKNPVAFSVCELRRNETMNQEILECIQTHSKEIFDDIRKITGILLKNIFLEEILDNYLAAREYCYTHTNMYNIPYSILYTRSAIDLFGRKVSAEGVGRSISKAINEKSKFFYVNDGHIQKRGRMYVYIQLIISNHDVKKNQMMMKIEERMEDEKTSNIIFKNKIDIEPCIYE